MTTPGRSPAIASRTAFTARVRVVGLVTSISRPTGAASVPACTVRKISCRSALRITSRNGLPSPRMPPSPNMARARSFMSRMCSWPSTAMTPSTIASSIAVVLDCSCSRSWIFSRRRAAITLSDRPRVPISSMDRVGARTRKLPPLICRAIDCISTTGRVTRPATKMPMPSAISRASAPPTSITWWRLAYERVTAESGRARRRTPTIRSPSRTGSAT